MNLYIPTNWRFCPFRLLISGFRPVYSGPPFHSKLSGNTGCRSNRSNCSTLKGFRRIGSLHNALASFLPGYRIGYPLVVYFSPDPSCVRATVGLSTREFSEPRRMPVGLAKSSGPIRRSFSTSVAQPLNRGLAMAVLKKFRRFNIQFISLNSPTIALKSRIKFLRSSSPI